jgi:hypothetical protein
MQEEREVCVRLTDGTLARHTGIVDQKENGSITIRDKNGRNLSAFAADEFVEWYYDDSEV